MRDLFTRNSASSHCSVVTCLESLRHLKYIRSGGDSCLVCGLSDAQCYLDVTCSAVMETCLCSDAISDCLTDACSYGKDEGLSRSENSRDARLRLVVG